MFCVRLKKQPVETYALLQLVYGAQCLSRPTVKIWHKLYSEGSMKVGVVPCGSTKRTVATEVNVNTVVAAIQEDRPPFDSKIRANVQHFEINN